LHYKFAHSSLIASYEKFTSSGSGFFAGAETQAARLGYKRPLGRTWDFYGDLSFSHNAKLQSAEIGVPASSYNEGSAGAVFRKHLGRSYDFFAAYRFSEVAFNTAITLDGASGRIDQRNIGTVGIEWHPRPTRIE
jgi:polyisoprenoid-binding protein YceI